MFLGPLHGSGDFGGTCNEPNLDVTMKYSFLVLCNFMIRRFPEELWASQNQKEGEFPGLKK